VLAAAFNFRDLGGIGTADGRQVRAGRVFRSNGLFDLTGEECAALQARCGLRTVIDLRGPVEADGEPAALLEACGVRTVRLPLLDEERQQPGVITDFLARYQGYLAHAGGSIVAGLRIIADETAGPVLFHCTAGKDRTGVLAAVLLGCLGVPDKAIVADYSATRGDARLVEFLRRRPGRADLAGDAPVLDTDPAVMAAFLAFLGSEYGGAAGWALSAGLAPAVLARLADTLLE
jgi:hypothetical protein